MTTQYITAELSNGINQMVSTKCQFESTQLDYVRLHINSYVVDYGGYINSLSGGFPYRLR